MTPAKATIAKILLVVVYLFAFVMVYHYLPGVGEPLNSQLGPLIISGTFMAISNRLLAGLDQASAKMAQSVDAAARKTSMEIDQLRAELERYHRNEVTKAAGFRMSPNEES